MAKSGKKSAKKSAKPEAKKLLVFTSDAARSVSIKDITAVVAEAGSLGSALETSALKEEFGKAAAAVLRRAADKSLDDLKVTWGYDAKGAPIYAKSPAQLVAVLLNVKETVTGRDGAKREQYTTVPKNQHGNPTRRVANAVEVLRRMGQTWLFNHGMVLKTPRKRMSGLPQPGAGSRLVLQYPGGPGEKRVVTVTMTDTQAGKPEIVSRFVDALLLKCGAAGARAIAAGIMARLAKQGRAEKAA